MKREMTVVFGGSEGIGKEIARGLVKKGHDVVILSRSVSKLNAAKAELGKDLSNGQRLEALPVDVGSWDSVNGVFSRLVETMGTPENVINCAGFARPGYIDELDVDYFRKMMELNYMGTVHVCKAAVPFLKKAGRGHIVTTSSLAGFIGLFGYTGYCGSKFAVNGFTEALKRELKPFGIKVSVLCPPNTNTPGLAEENKFKPAEVLKTEEKAKPVDPSVVAQATISALGKDQLLIHPTFDGKLAHVLGRFVPSVLNQFVKRPNP